jgi:hypothetical protein
MHIFIIVRINCKAWHNTFVHIKMCSWWRSIQTHWLKMHSKFTFELISTWSVHNAFCLYVLPFISLFFFSYYYCLNRFIMWTVLYFTECSDGDHGFDCVYHCETCHNILCERFEGNCTHGCIEGFKGHQCLVSGFWNLIYHCKN